MFIHNVLGIVAVLISACGVRSFVVPHGVEADAGVAVLSDGGQDGGFCFANEPAVSTTVMCAQSARNEKALLVPGETAQPSRISCRTNRHAYIDSLRVSLMARLYTQEFVDATPGEVPRAELLENNVMVAEGNEPDDEGYVHFRFSPSAVLVEESEKIWTVRLYFGPTRRGMVAYTVLFWSDAHMVEARSAQGGRAVVNGELHSTPSTKVSLANAYPVIEKALGTPAGALVRTEETELARFNLWRLGNDIILDPLLRVCARGNGFGLLTIQAWSSYRFSESITIAPGQCDNFPIRPYEADSLAETISLRTSGAHLDRGATIQIVMYPRETKWVTASGHEIDSLPSGEREIVFPWLTVP